jgi:hypothetical protein
MKMSKSVLWACKQAIYTAFLLKADIPDFFRNVNVSEIYIMQQQQQ